jgi:predicted RNA binding protein YcfA (HicA-like mRNA interferase family)
MNRYRIDKLIFAEICGSNWRNKYNLLDEIYTDKVLDLIADHLKYKDDLVDQDFVEMYAIKHVMDNLDLDSLNTVQIKDKTLDCISRINKVMDRLEGHKKTLKKSTYDMLRKVKTYQDEITDLVAPTLILGSNMNSNSIDKESEKLYKRSSIFSKKMQSMIESLGGTEFCNLSILKDISVEIDMLLDLVMNRIEASKVNQVKEEIKKSKNNYSKIFNPKDMVKLCEDNGFITKRNNGDHIIMIHTTSNKGVVVPNHSLGFSLQREIQKQVRVNSVA